MAIALFGEGGFVPGSDGDWINTHGTTPVLGDLTPYEVVVVATNAVPADRAGLGDVLADYVDGGGRVVMTAFCFFTGADVQGRIATAGYAPFQSASGAGDGSTRMFDVATLTLPLHPVFQGLNVTTWASPAFAAMTSGTLLGSPTVLAAFTNGHNAVALNTGGSVMAVNVVPTTNLDDPPTMELIANAVLFLAGEL